MEYINTDSETPSVQGVLKGHPKQSIIQVIT